LWFLHLYTRFFPACEFRTAFETGEIADEIDIERFSLLAKL
jgi:hypothetical protein